MPPPAPLSSKAKKSSKTSKSPGNDSPGPNLRESPSGVPAIKKSLSWKSLDKLKLSKKSAYSVHQTAGDTTPK